MPRRPTGNPRGRPVGTFTVLQESSRSLTVRLPESLHERLCHYAETAHAWGSRAPDVSRVVRELLEETLERKLSIQDALPLSSEDNRQMVNGTDIGSAIICHTENKREARTDTQPFDVTRFALGKPCQRGHLYGDTGQTLRELRGGQVKECVACHRERSRQQSAARQVARKSLPI